MRHRPSCRPFAVEPLEPRRLLAAAPLAHTAGTLPEPQETDDVLAVGAKLFFVGGSSFNDPVNNTFNPSDAVNVYDTSTGQWTAEHFPAGGRTSVAAVAVGTKAIFAGGYVAGRGFGDLVEIYDTSTGQWSTTHLPVSDFRSFRAAAVGGKAFFVARDDDQIQVRTPLAYVYDVAADTWATVPIPRACVGVLAVGSQVVFPGGPYNVTRRGERVQRFDRRAVIYDADTDRWTTTTMPAVPRFAFSDGIAVGGKGVFELQQNVLSIYDPVTGRWFLRRPPPGGRGRPVTARAAVGNKLVLFLGSDGLDDRHVAARVYDTVTNRWTATHLLTPPRMGLVGVALGGKALFAGGLPNVSLHTRTDAVDVYDAVTGRWSQTTLSEARDTRAAAAAGTRAVYVGGDLAHPGNSTTPPVSDAFDVFTDPDPTPLLTGTIVGHLAPTARGRVRNTTFAVTVTNAGNAPTAGPFTVALRARQPGEGDIVLGTARASGVLSPGESRRVFVDVHAPPGYAATHAAARLFATAGDAPGAPAFASRADALAPSAELVEAPARVGRAGAVTFSIAYHDAGAGLDRQTIGDDDLLITGRRFANYAAHLISLTRRDRGSTRVATYSIPAARAFDAADNGVYTIHLLGFKVTDRAGNAVAPRPLGTFIVDIPATDSATVRQLAQPQTVAADRGIDAPARDLLHDSTDADLS